jgi:integrase
MIGLNHQQLTFLHISNEKAEPTPELVKSIEGRPKRKGTTDERHEAYTGETLSRVKRIALEILGISNNKDGAAVEAALLKKLPVSVKSIVIHLPRVNGSRANLNRSKLRLSERSLEALKVMVNVALRRDVKSPEELLLTRQSELTQEVYATVKEPSKWSSVIGVFTRVKEKMGMPTKKTSASLPEEKVPPKLKLQLGRYEELAPTGAYGYPELCTAGNKANVPINPHEENTIKTNKTMLLLFLGELVTEGHDISDMDITDLIKVDPVILPDNTVSYNKYIDPFRERQRQQTDIKVGGRDSPRFEITLQAIKAVAAYNGIFKYHEKFKEAYKVHIDLKSRRKRKKDKKEAFTGEWLDKNLTRLKPRFEAIIKSKSFRKNLDDLWLCMCYVYIMTLSHTGIRQQGIRYCRKGWNIFFLKREAIKFLWREDEIKNDKEYLQTVKSSHVNTCAPLVDTLNKYNKHILPFLEELADEQGTDTEGQFFLRVGKDFSVRPFDVHESRTFSTTFKVLSRKYLDFTDVPVHMRPKFNAHHIRGLASDRMHDELGMGSDLTSKFLGNARRTTEEDYLQRNRVDATPVVDEAEERAAALKERRRREGLSVVEKAKEQVSPESQALREALNDSLARERKMAEEIAELKARFGIKSSEVSRSAA